MLQCADEFQSFKRILFKDGDRMTLTTDKMTYYKGHKPYTHNRDGLKIAFNWVDKRSQNEECNCMERRNGI